jgi:hypothetical protein
MELYIHSPIRVHAVVPHKAQKQVTLYLCRSVYQCGMRNLQFTICRPDKTVIELVHTLELIGLLLRIVTIFQSAATNETFTTKLRRGNDYSYKNTVAVQYVTKGNRFEGCFVFT